MCLFKGSTSSAYLKLNLNSSKTGDNDSLRIPGFDLIWSDHPSNNKRGVVAIYYKIFCL